MAKTYRIQTPDGKTIQVEGPEDATDDELIAFARSQVSPKFQNSPVVRKPETPAAAPEKPKVDTGASFFYGLGDGATLGLLDEAGAAVSSVLPGDAPSIWNGNSYSDAYAANLARNRSVLAGAQEQHPIATTAGSIAGLAVPGAGLTGAATRAINALSLGRRASLAARLAGEAVLGGAYGAGSGTEGNRGESALTGAAGGIVGGVAGRALARPVSALARTAPAQSARALVANILNRAAPAAPAAPSAAVSSLLAAAQKGGLPQINSQLDEAASMGLPMALVDTHPELRELGGAVVRRSPSASKVAEETLAPRNRGQIDRLGQAVARDLGPTTNIPQLAADMTAQARLAAGPLYDRAYAAPVISTPEIEATLNTPFGRSALSRARTIAANERRAPEELGFAQDANGDVVLNPRPNQAIAHHLAARDELDAAQEAYRAARSQPGSMESARNRLTAARDRLRKAEAALSAAPDPSMPANVPGYTTQTLDYVKRGMDDVLEQQRNPITGRLVLDEAGRAQNQVRGQFLREVDRINPAYSDARNAYAGPVQARDALTRGQDAFGINPDELAIQVSNQTPEHLAQMQLGYRDQLMKQASGVRYSTNPFEATLGTPAAEQRLYTLYPGNPGVERLLRQRDLERNLAQTVNSILGNSKTAQRKIADEAFGDDTLGQIVDAGVNVAMGQIPTGFALKQLSGQWVKDAYKMGIGKKAVEKADELAPVLFNTDPVAAKEALQRMLSVLGEYQSFVTASRAQTARPLAAAGTAAGALAAR